MVKDEILKLREEGLSYNEIKDKLGCSKSIISYHCKRWNLNDIGLTKGRDVISIIEDVKEFYKNHTKKETAIYFNISESSVTKYKNKKRKILTDFEKKEKKKIYYLSFRQKLKNRCVEYKGGKCIVCGYNKCNNSLDFHHRIPSEKDFCISSTTVLKWNKIKIELDKCDLMCKNCHGELHEKLNFENAGLSPLPYTLLKG